MASWIITALDLVGVVVFALSGATLGIRKHLDGYGVVVLGFITALGGGVIRDVLLGVRPYTLTTVAYPALAILSGVALFVLRPSRLLRINRLMSIFDAVGLGMVAASTTAKALELGGYPWLTCAILGVIAGSGGGMVRDVLAGEIPLVLRPGELYATAAFVGGIVVTALWHLTALNHETAVWLGAAVTTGMRLASIKYQITLPPAREL